MKKLISIMFAAVLCLAFAACSSDAGKADAVAQKIENSEELTQEDYTVMLNYSLKALDYTKDVMKKMGDNPTKEEFEKYDEEATAKFPHMDAFSKALTKVKEADLDEANQKLEAERVEKVQEILTMMMGK